MQFSNIKKELKLNRERHWACKYYCVEGATKTSITKYVDPYLQCLNFWDGFTVKNQICKISIFLAKISPIFEEQYFFLNTIFDLPDCSLYDEKALLAEIAAGDEQAFRKLFDLYRERFYSVVLKMTRSREVAEDIVQDIFMNIWNKRADLVNIENPSSYFFTAVYRRVYHHYRKIALEKKLLSVAPPADQLVNTTEEMVLAHESSQLISQAVDQLPPKQQLVFKLCKQEGKSREDVARQLNISPNTVKNHLTEAIKYIRTSFLNSIYTFLFIFWFFRK